MANMLLPENRQRVRAMIELFKKAKKILWDGKGPGTRRENTKYICHALVLCDGEYSTAVNDCSDMVMRGIGSHGTVRSWAANKRRRKTYSLSDRLVQKTRHGYLDALIKHCEDSLK